MVQHHYPQPTPGAMQTGHRRTPKQFGTLAHPSACRCRTAALLPDPSKGGPCALAAEKPQNVKAWLSGIEGQVAALVGDNATATNGGAAAAAATRLNRVFNPSVFSHLEWEDPCQPGAVISQPIEPLIGHFRHPLGPQCIKDSTVHIESR